MWHLAQVIEKPVDTNRSCYNSVSGKVVAATVFAVTNFLTFYINLWSVGKKCSKLVLLSCFIDACVPLVQNQIWNDKTHRIVSSNFNKLDFIRIKFTSKKQNMELKHEGLEDDYFPFQRGVILGYFAVKGASSTGTWTTVQSCENGHDVTSVRVPGSTKGAPVGDTHARLKWNVLQVPADFTHSETTAENHPQQIGSNFFLQKIQLLKVP